MCRSLAGPILLMSLCAAPLVAQDAPNATRKVEISLLFLGSTWTGGSWKSGRCVDAAVTVTESVAVVGATCATHQFLNGVEAEESLGSYRGGVRFRKRHGRRITAFVEGLAGAETGYRYGGFRSNSGFSLDAGGGVDLALKKWFAVRILYAKYQTTFIDGGNVNGLRLHAGVVFRIGEK